MRAWFVTGTDTGVGKTWVTLGLMAALQQRGLRVAGMKPVASGCIREAEGLRNEDALAIQRQASLSLTYEQLNPYAFEPPVSPHIAASEAGVVIEPTAVRQGLDALQSQTDAVVVEGVGGWAVPLAPGYQVADLAEDLGLPVVLVVGLRLGCLNHALLTARAIGQSGVPLTAWVASCLDPEMQRLWENVETLQEALEIPCLGVLPWQPDALPAEVGEALDLDILLK